MSSIGLIAGAGDLPVYFARQAKRSGFSLKTVAVRGAASTKLNQLSDEIIWVSIGQVGALLSFFNKKSISRVVMHGKVQHSSLFKSLRLDWKALSLWTRLKDRSGEAILKALADEMGRNGIRLQDSRFLMEEILPQPGWITGKPDAESIKMIQYGLKKAKALAQLGIGQSLMIKKNAVVAAEAMEGTDETILRAGRCGGPGSILVKVSSPGQDWRFDVPTIGPKTLHALVRAKAKGVVIEAGKSFLLNQTELALTAKKFGLFIYAVK